MAEGPVTSRSLNGSSIPPRKGSPVEPYRIIQRAVHVSGWAAAMISAGQQLLSAGVKPLLWHPEPKDGSWAKVPDQGRDSSRGWSFRAAASVTELDELVAAHTSAHGESGGIGVLLGKPSGALVLEYDPRNFGDQAFLQLLEQARWNASASVAAREVICWKSGRGDGGGGFLMALPGEEDLAALKVLVAGFPGVDLLADGRFQVLPPSLHPDSGKPYQWVVEPGPLLVPQLVPSPLLKLARARVQSHVGGHSLGGAGGPAAELPQVIEAGQRDTVLTSFAGSMRRRGAGEDEILEMLRVINRRCQPAHSEADLARIARSVASYPAGSDPVLDRKLAEWARAAVSSAEPAAKPAGLIPSLGEMIGAPEGVEALKRAALQAAAAREVRLARAAAEFADPGRCLTLEESLALPRAAEPWVMPGCWRAGHVVVLAALFKTGKSRLAAAAAGALADGRPFLGGTNNVRQSRVSWWNLEMTGPDADDYLAAETEPGSRDRVRVAHLRSSPVPLLRSEPARRWARENLEGCQVWVVDTWTRLCAWNGVDVNDNAGASELAACLDELKAGAGVTELMILAHMPKGARTEPSAETALGAQALSGWADCLWMYWRDPESGSRFLRMEGRNVEVGEFTVAAVEGRLVAAAGSRASASSAGAEGDGGWLPAAEAKILQVVTANQLAGAMAVPMTANLLKERCGGNAARFRTARDALVASGKLLVQPHQHGGHTYVLPAGPTSVQVQV